MGMCETLWIGLGVSEWRLKRRAANLEFIVDNELGDELRKTKHVDEGCQSRDDETVPAPMTVVHQRISGVSQKTRDGNVRDISEG